MFPHVRARRILLHWIRRAARACGLLLVCALVACYPRMLLEDLPGADRLTEDLALSSYLLSVLLAGSNSVQYAYVSNSNDGTVSAFLLDSRTGDLSANGVSSAGAGTTGIVADRANRFVYAANRTAGTLSLFSVEGDGTLTAGGSVGTPSANPVEIARHPTLDVLYTSHGTATDQILAHDQNAMTGALALADTENSPPGPNDIRIHPNGNILYTTYLGAEDIEWYTINGAGILSPRGFQSGGGGSQPYGVAVHPGGLFAYFSMEGLDQIRRYDINAVNGDLSGLTTTATLAGPNMMAMQPDGSHLYVACATANQVQSFSINPANGALTASGAVTAGGGVTGLAIDANAAFLYSTNFTGDSVSIFSIAADGTLAPAGTIGAGDGALRITIVPATL